MITLKSSVSTAAKHLSRALLAAANPLRAWTPALDQTLHRLLPSTAPLTPSLVAAAIDPHLFPHHPLAAGLFHWAARQPGFSHSPKSYHALLKSLSLYRHELSPSLHNSLLAAASSDGFPDVARKVFDEMLKRGTPFTDLGFGVFIGMHCRSVELDETLRLVEEIKWRVPGINGSVVAFLIVDGLCRVGRDEDAWRSLEELRMRGCKPDFIPYRLVSEAFRSAGRAEDAGRILKQKRKFGVAPRANDYREFIMLLILERRIREAKEMGEAIVDGDFPIEDEVLSALIGSVSDVDPSSAVSFCRYMIGKGRFPSLTMLSNLSMSLCKNERSNEMWEFFVSLMDTGYFSGVEQYNVMVSFLCKAGRVREAYEVLKEMKKNGLHPDISSYNTLMEACCREDLLRPAKKLWDEMFANGCCPNLQTYNTLLQKLSEEGEAEEAEHLFHHMLNKGVVPDNVTYTSLVQVMCREKRVDAALDIFKRSMGQDVVIAGSTLNALILSLCKEGNFVAASGLLNGLASTIQSSDSHVILLKSLTDAGENEIAIKHIEWVKNNSASKLRTILTEFIASLSTAPKLEPVLEFLQAMHARGFISDDGPWLKLLEARYEHS